MREVDDMMRAEGSFDRTTKVKKKQLKVIYSFDSKEAFKSARNTFTNKRHLLDTGVFIDKQESAKLKDKRQALLNQDAYGNRSSDKPAMNPQFLSMLSQIPQPQNVVNQNIFIFMNNNQGGGS